MGYSLCVRVLLWAAKRRFGIIEGLAERAACSKLRSKGDTSPFYERSEYRLRSDSEHKKKPLRAYPSTTFLAVIS